jgi:hypothetical protein
MDNEKKPDNTPHIEETYPGIQEQIERFQKAELPACTHCGSDQTARVQVGFVPRLANIAAATGRMRRNQSELVY